MNVDNIKWFLGKYRCDERRIPIGGFFIRFSRSLNSWLCRRPPSPPPPPPPLCSPGQAFRGLWKAFGKLSFKVGHLLRQKALGTRLNSSNIRKVRLHTKQRNGKRRRWEDQNAKGKEKGSLFLPNPLLFFLNFPGQRVRSRRLWHQTHIRRRPGYSFRKQLIAKTTSQEALRRIPTKFARIPGPCNYCITISTPALINTINL